MITGGAIKPNFPPPIIAALVPTSNVNAGHTFGSSFFNKACFAFSLATGIPKSTNALEPGTSVGPSNG